MHILEAYLKEPSFGKTTGLEPATLLKRFSDSLKRFKTTRGVYMTPASSKMEFFVSQKPPSYMLWRF